MTIIAHTFDDQAIDADSWRRRWPNFTWDEMRCNGSGVVIVDPQFMDRLQALRTFLGFALPVNSGFRSPAYNDDVSKTGTDGPHTGGKSQPPGVDLAEPDPYVHGAVDIGVNGHRAFKLIKAAPSHGFTGIGVKQNGPHHKRFVHLDCLPHMTGQPRPWVWSY